jgi:hypothetical protein
MNPEFRKLASETLLHKQGVRINLQLPEIESNDEVTLRSAEDVFHRLITLWIVVSVADQRNSMHFREYIAYHKIESWLSAEERDFVMNSACSDEDCARFSARQEGLFFLAWCAGLFVHIEIPSHRSSLELIKHLFPVQMEAPAKLQKAMHLRSKNTILDWADLLYRLNWAVRHASLIGKTTPGSLDSIAVEEWHHAVNWMIRYDDEENWDLVGTET